jgi:hypothetical protein
LYGTRPYSASALSALRITAKGKGKDRGKRHGNSKSHPRVVVDIYRGNGKGRMSDAVTVHIVEANGETLVVVTSCSCAIAEVFTVAIDMTELELIPIEKADGYAEN